MSRLERLAYAAAGLVLVLGGLAWTELAAARRAGAARVAGIEAAWTSPAPDCLRWPRRAGG
ncbi:hypothetical protein PQJ75_25550 [Rhodoplanes sp. TEM]|uniref:Uncharacterized protein n=1 Tax=Rhodoplanes tepidamans TaxID=200616 RepID=A0ABT5JGT7_RHOTP|nr:MULTISPECIES: hypothetical protein [Rhodoplanes]MDC7788822.1 hypothetical protein [Rhodoplanes tepidamans]MDC7987111.1 hypothetical protein [Rhodoplanes sp. TEM]MDQ0357506.1 thiamine monophosphate synthase [Rhodoplanes tepidamans]